jgi:hypothetical protein
MFRANLNQARDADRSPCTKVCTIDPRSGFASAAAAR